ncbi:MAG: MATE family efflux transporter, partial [Ruthenibacterium lactatiformans]
MVKGTAAVAQRYFSMLVYVTIGGGIVFSVLGLGPGAPHRRAFWAHLGCHAGGLLSVYGGIPALAGARLCSCCKMCSRAFSSTAEKPHFGLGVTVAAGLTNIILDFLFIAAFRWG